MTQIRDAAEAARAAAQTFAPLSDLVDALERIGDLETATTEAERKLTSTRSAIAAAADELARAQDRIAQANASAMAVKADGDSMLERAGNTVATMVAEAEGDAQRIRAEARAQGDALVDGAKAQVSLLDAELADKAAALAAVTEELAASEGKLAQAAADFATLRESAAAFAAR